MRSSILTAKKWKEPEGIKSNKCDAELTYAVLEADTRIRVVGYDPRIGILHIGDIEKSRTRLLEPMRLGVDGAILNFVRDRTFSAADFVLPKDGVCRLTSQLARAVAQCTQGSLVSDPDQAAKRRPA